MYRTAHASWYGPGLYGGHLGCGGTLDAGDLGVAHKSLPCGTKVTLRHHGRVVRVPVIDRGPYVAGREYDLTEATAQRLKFRGHGAIQSTVSSDRTRGVACLACSGAWRIWTWTRSTCRVELMRRPELRGRPVVVAGSGPRAVVTTASYEARRYGVFSAIPAARARRLCPEATFLPPDFEAYRAMSKRVMDRVRAQVETVEVVGLDEAYLDLSGLFSPRAAMRRLISEIKADTGLSASVGIGPNRLVAKVASDAEKPQGFVVLTREQACERFAEAPPRLLPGIGAKTAERLEALGIATIAQLAATPPETLAERFGGRLGPYLLRPRALRGRLARSPASASRSRSRARRRSRPTSPTAPSRSPCCAGSPASCARAWPSTSAAGRTIAIKVRLDDFTTVTRARTIPVATNDPAVVADVACALLDEYAPPRPVRLLGVRVAAFEEDAADGEDAPQMTLAL